MDIKRQIRLEIAAKVAALPAEARGEAVARLCRRLPAILEEACAGKGLVAAFVPMPDEIDVTPLLDRLVEDGWKVVVPKVEGEEMEFYDYLPGNLEPGAWGILEPLPSAARVDAGEIDVMIVPGRAFTPEGDRLGRGKGFYDRYMSRKGFRAATVGVCYECQLAESLPAEPHDRKVGCVEAF